MAGYVCPRIVPSSEDIQIAKDVIATIAARGTGQATLRGLELERTEELLHQRARQPPEGGRLNEAYNTLSATEIRPEGQQRALDDADLFFDGFDPSIGWSEYGFMDLADALTIGDFDFLGE